MKGSKVRPRKSGAMPGPRSRTRTLTPSPVRLTPHGYLGVERRELQGVLDDVAEHPFHEVRVADHDRRLRVPGEADPGRACNRSRPHDLLAHRLQPHRLHPGGLSLHRRQHRDDQLVQPLVRSVQSVLTARVLESARSRPTMTSV